MNRIITCLAIASSVLLIGCVTRTTTVGPSRGKDGDIYGLGSNPKVVEKKFIWIWEKEFRNSD